MAMCVRLWSSRNSRPEPDWGMGVVSMLLVRMLLGCGWGEEDTGNYLWNRHLYLRLFVRSSFLKAFSSRKIHETHGSHVRSACLPMALKYYTQPQSRPNKRRKLTR